MMKRSRTSRFFDIIYCVAALLAPAAGYAGTTCPNDPEM
jgi:hypothetical protein